MNQENFQPRKKFTDEEDEFLKSLVTKYGIKAWNKISELMPGRTPRQCRERYGNYLQPHLLNGEWTQEDEKKLIEKYNEIGPKWAKIAEFFETRSDVNVKNHFAAMKRRGQLNQTIETKPVFISSQITNTAPEEFLSYGFASEDYWIHPNEHTDNSLTCNLCFDMN